MPVFRDLRDPEAFRAGGGKAGNPLAVLTGGGITGLPDLFRLAVNALVARDVAPDSAACAHFVPGRVEVLGKHTDYGGGRSLLAALNRGFCVVAAARGDNLVSVSDAVAGVSAVFRLTPDLPSVTGWSNYAATVVRRTARNFPMVTRGADIAFAGNLPAASGMSSSSALMVGLFLALVEANGLAATEVFQRHLGNREELAGYLAAMENGSAHGSLAGDGGVGTHGGSQDHTAILCARPGRLVRYSFAPVRFEGDVPLPPGHILVMAASGVRAEKTGATRELYNRAADLLDLAAELWRGATGRNDAHIGAVLSSGPGAAEELRRILKHGAGSVAPAARLMARVEQFIQESEIIVPAATEALAAGDLAGFAANVRRSQELAQQMLGNQVPETVSLVQSARELGAVAASAFGAGFGGGVWALVRQDQAPEFLADWREAYVARFPERSGDVVLFPSPAGYPATRII